MVKVLPYRVLPQLVAGSRSSKPNPTKPGKGWTRRYSRIGTWSCANFWSPCLQSPPDEIHGMVRTKRWWRLYEESS